MTSSASDISSYTVRQLTAPVKHSATYISAACSTGSTLVDRPEPRTDNSSRTVLAEPDNQLLRRALDTRRLRCICGSDRTDDELLPCSACEYFSHASCVPSIVRLLDVFTCSCCTNHDRLFPDPQVPPSPTGSTTSWSSISSQETYSSSSTGLTEAIASDSAYESFEPVNGGLGEHRVFATEDAFLEYAIDVFNSKPAGATHERKTGKNGVRFVWCRNNRQGTRQNPGKKCRWSIKAKEVHDAHSGVSYYRLLHRRDQHNEHCLKGAKKVASKTVQKKKKRTAPVPTRESSPASSAEDMTDMSLDPDTRSCIEALSLLSSGSIQSKRVLRARGKNGYCKSS